MIYILIYLLNQNLPWMNTNSKGFKEKFKKILWLKETLDISMVAVGKASKEFILT